jgi:hypothetical protein
LISARCQRKRKKKKEKEKEKKRWGNGESGQDICRVGSDLFVRVGERYKLSV